MAHFPITPGVSAVNMPRLLSLTLILMLAGAASARAEWGWPSLNPFQKDSHPASVAQKGSGWQWPGKADQPATQQPAGPSMWQRVSSAPKTAWTKTKAVVYPWGNKPAAPPPEPIQITGTNSYFAKMANGNQKPPAKKSFWAWGADEDNRKPQKASSVSEFIGGRRPE